MRIIHVSTKKCHPCFSDVVFLQSRSHDVIFVILDQCDDPRYNVASSYNEDGVMYIHLSVRKDFDFAFDPRLESAFLRFLKEFNPDIIHLQLFSGVNALSILRASSGASAKKVVTLHIHSLFCLSGACFDKGQVCHLNSMEECSCENCLSFARHEKLSLSRYNLIRKGRCEEIVSLADVIICCSRWQRDTIQRLLGKEAKTVVLYYGVKQPSEYKYKSTVTRFEIEAAEIDWKSFVGKMVKNGWGKRANAVTIRFQDGCDDEKDKIQKVLGADFKKLLSVVRRPIGNVQKKSSLPSFGYLGSLWELKGIEVLLDSIQRLSHLRFQVLMGVIFDPTNAKDVIQLKKLEGCPLIRIMPNLPSDDYHEKFFSQIDYLIIPSVWEETGPMTLFEAFYHKTPVIISDRPSMIEKTIEGVNSLIFNNASTLAEIMKNIIGGRVALRAGSREDFPVKTSEEYTAVLESIYFGKIGSVNSNSLTLNVGSACNNNCVFCVRGSNDLIRKVDFDILKNMLEKYRGRHGQLKITGGEPTMRKDLASILKVAAQLEYKVTLETNARMFANERLAQLIARYDPKFVTHLESQSSLMHDGLTRKKGSFFQTVAGIRNVLKHGGTVAVKIMIMKHNYQDLLIISKLIVRLGASQIIFVFLDPGGHAEKFFDTIVPRYSQVRPYLSEALTWLVKNKDIKVTLENFPFCFLEPAFRGLESQRIEKVGDKNLSFSPVFGKARMYASTFERRKRKEKSPKCLFCKFDSVCEGVYKRYIDSFGWQEIRPVSSEEETNSKAVESMPKQIP